MTDRPINFSAPRVLALMAGAKTQTRRVVMDAAEIARGPWTGPARRHESGDWQVRVQTYNSWKTLPVRYAVGDRLWVREAYYQSGHWEPQQALTKGGAQKWAFVAADDLVRFDAPESFRKAMDRKDPATVAWHKRLGRFMPRWASRATLHVTDVRVERLNDISPDDAEAEGLWRGLVNRHLFWRNAAECRFLEGRSHEAVFADLWDSINGDGAWAENPLVVALTFKAEVER